MQLFSIELTGDVILENVNTVTHKSDHRTEHEFASSDDVIKCNICRSVIYCNN